MVVALSLIVKVILVVKLTQACENSIEQNINGCDFDPLDIIVESTGFLITSENCGLIVPKENFFERPHVFYYKAEEDQMYTLIMIEESGDLGFDKRSLLWLVSNIPGNNLKYGMGDSIGTKHMEYQSPKSSENIESVRCILLLYKQLHLIEIPQLNDNLESFDLLDWTESIEPREAALCGPVASIKFEIKE